MVIPIIIPKLGMTMSEATLVEWKASEADQVERGAEVLTIETEKVSSNIEASASGFLHILLEANNIARVGQTVGQIAESRNELEILQNKGETDRDVIIMPTEADVLQNEPTEGPSERMTQKSFSPASPAARSLAKKLGIDITAIAGSGPEGRIIEKDILDYCEKAEQLNKTKPLAENIAENAGLNTDAVESTGDRGKITSLDVKRAIEIEKHEGVSAGSIKKISMTAMRKTIARAMYNSIHKTAQVSVFAEVDVTDLLRIHQEIKTKYNNEVNVRISHTDLMILATCRALKRFPIMNSTFIDDEILVYDEIHMGVAVALPQGLIVPVLRNADKKGLLEIARERSKLVGNAREGRLTLQDVVGGTFTISNISMFSVDGATPILNSPENGILAFGRIREKPTVHLSQIAVRSIMVVSLTFDHQVIDGAPAAQFLTALVQYMENPNLMLL
jgi:pyruvate dehydrogenase E2 component (dihydrolipoamide acetyltransferase)